MTPELSASLARRVLPLIDLTSLNDQDDEAVVRRLASDARTPFGDVAAICIWPRFLPVARAALLGTNLPVAAVTNFPAGDADAALAAEETAEAVDAGADEIDVVFPYRALLAGDREAGLALVQACREACDERAILKVILESGQLATEPMIRLAAETAIEGGAHFLKTSTGKTQPGATVDAARIMLDAIAEARRHDIQVGFKASGGIRTLADAATFLTLYEERLGTADASVFRIGASSLLREVLDALAL